MTLKSHLGSPKIDESRTNTFGESRETEIAAEFAAIRERRPNIFGVPRRPIVYTFRFK